MFDRKYVCLFASMFSIISLTSFQRDLGTQGTHSVTCFSDINSDHLLAFISRNIERVSLGELPVLALQYRGDTTYCYFSALAATSSLIKNPPSTISSFKGRDIVIYNGSERMIHIDSTCYNNLLNKYQRILNVDKIIAKKRLPIRTKYYYTYDPICVRTTVVKNKVVGTDNSVSGIPYFDYSF